MTDPISLDAYQTRLPSFEGPLDVLLRLIERQKLDITEVSLVAVTDHFLDHLKTLEEHRPDIVGEFTAVGARLTLLKSRSLLPRPPAVLDEAEVDEEDLVTQLRIYKRIKDVAQELGDRRARGVTSYGARGEIPLAKPEASMPVRLATYHPSVLARAVRRRLSAVAIPAEIVRARKVVSIRDVTERVISLVTRLKRVPFGRVVEATASRTDAATAFLAVLVLVRRRAIDVSQETLFGAIELVSIASNGLDDTSGIDDEFVN